MSVRKRRKRLRISRSARIGRLRRARLRKVKRKSAAMRSGGKPLNVKKIPDPIPAEATGDRMYDQGYDTGYSKGYEAGRHDTQKESAPYQDGYDKGHKDGFEKGKHAGGDGIVDSILGEYEILPDIPIEHIIAAGVEQYRPNLIRLASAQEIGDRMLAALEAKEPFSLVRLGDGELLTLAQEIVMPVEEIRQEASFLSYAGVQVPDLTARDRLLTSIRQATYVGIPKLRVKHFLPLAFAAFKAHQLDYTSLRLTDSLVNYYLHHTGYLPRLTEHRRVLVVGNKAAELAELLWGQGVHVAAAISPVNGVHDVDRVMDEVNRHEFDLAFVSAGIAAVILAERIATERGKVAVDLGHLADSLVKGDTAFR